MQTTPKTIFAGIMLMTALGCDDGAADRIENRAKCREICSQVKECDDDFDTGVCTNDCVDLALDDTTETRVEDCAACIQVLDECSENVSNCATRCAGVVTLTVPATQ